MATYYYDKNSTTAGFGSFASSAAWLGVAHWGGSAGTTSPGTWPNNSVTRDSAYFGNTGVTGTTGTSFADVVSPTTGLTVPSGTTVHLKGIQLRNIATNPTMMISGAGTLDFGSGADGVLYNGDTSSYILGLWTTVSGSGTITTSGAGNLVLYGGWAGFTGTLVHTATGWITMRPLTTGQNWFSSTNRATVRTTAGDIYLQPTSYAGTTGTYHCNFEGNGRVQFQGDMVSGGTVSITGSLQGLSSAGFSLWGTGTANIVDLPTAGGPLTFRQTGSVTCVLSVSNVTYPTPPTWPTNLQLETNGTTSSFKSSGTQSFVTSGALRRIDAGASASTLSLGGTNTGANTISGNASNAASGQFLIRKDDAGTWVLTGNNTAVSALSVTAGVLRGTNANAFGAGTITISGGTVELDGAYTLANGITGTGGTVRCLSAGTSITGAITLSSGTTTIESTTGTTGLTTGSISGAGALALSGAGDFSFSRTMSAGSLAKTGAGALTLTTAARIAVPLAVTGCTVTCATKDNLTGATPTLNTGAKLIAATTDVSAPCLTLAGMTLNAGSAIQFGAT